MSKKYYIKTFGCQMNYSDSERFAGVIEKAGYKPTNDLGEADLIVFNSCSVRQKAEDRISGLRKQIEKLKLQNPKLKVVLTGCMARRAWSSTSKIESPLQMSQKSREDELKKQMPWVDLVLETKEFGKLPLKLGSKVKIEEKAEDYLSFTPKYESNFQAFVPISTGCNHFCTYCIVPFARGGEVNRPASDIIDEVTNLIHSGYTEITLLGQTVNRWINPKFEHEIKGMKMANTKIPDLNTKLLTSQVTGNRARIGTNIDQKNPKEPKDFLQLLQVLDGIDGEWWMTFISSHPNYMTDELIEFIGRSVKENKHMRPYLHFALQSGNNNILKRMNRRYTVEEFREKTMKMREEIPGLSISTDIIVGFPGETEGEFLDTAKLMRELEFDMAYINKYSPRKGTASALLKDTIPHKEKEKRKTYLNDEILAGTSTKNNEKMIGTTQRVLIKRIKGGIAEGQTKNMKDVRVEINKEDPQKKHTINVGEFTDVRITGATSWSLSGATI